MGLLKTIAEGFSQMVDGLLSLVGIEGESKMLGVAVVPPASRTKPKGVSLVPFAQVTVKPWQGRIVYDAHEWPSDAKLMAYWKSGDLVANKDIRQYMNGWNLAPQLKGTRELKVAKAADFARWMLQNPGSLDWNSMPGTAYETSREYDDGDEWSVSVPLVDGAVVVVRPRYPSTVNKKILALTGLWKMTRNGPEAYSVDRTIDAMTSKPCRDSYTQVKLKVRSEAGSVFRPLAPVVELHEVVEFEHHRKLKEDASSKAFYLWCKTYKAIGGNVPGPIKDIIKGFIKAFSSGLDKATR